MKIELYKGIDKKIISNDNTVQLNTLESLGWKRGILAKLVYLVKRLIK